MAPGYPIAVNGIVILTVEALYQSLRFPHLPPVQRLIIGERSPMTAKMRSKPFRADSRPDWELVRVAIMRFCLRLKLYHNPVRFGALLMETSGKPIVEESTRDAFWGAHSSPAEILEGKNVLGRLLMELRDCHANEAVKGAFKIVVPQIAHLDFLGKTITADALRHPPPANQSMSL